MKRVLSFILVLVLVLGAAQTALALNYTGHQGNEATFELLEETRVSGPEAIKDLEGNQGKDFESHPVLDNYPKGTTYVYRSANLYGGRASARQNTNLVVFAAQSFADKAAAKAYLESLGLIRIIDEAIGSVVLVTPANPDAGFGAADQKNYYALQTAMFALKDNSRLNGVSVNYSDAEYFGGYGFYYVIGIDGGATFLNNYVVGTLDYVSRIAGMLLVGGTMDRIRTVAAHVPVYLVNAPKDVVAKYEAINGVDAMQYAGDTFIAYNQALPLRKVVTVETDTVDLPAVISDAYYNLFIKAQRSQNLSKGYISASTPYQGYSQDCGPYSLVARNALINGVTKDGIHMIHHCEDRFNTFVMPNGEYLQTWYEYLPEELLDGTALDGTIPLLLLLHGGSDDPRLYVEEQGYLTLMGAERIAAVAPEHQYISDILPDCVPLLIHYMLDTYPALDPSRVYVNGYSLGGWATYGSLFIDASLFAAAVPQAMDVNVAKALWRITNREISAEEAKQFETIDMPLMCTTSEYDLFIDPVTHDITSSYLEPLNQYLGYNEMEKLPPLDHEKYPISGFKADFYEMRTLNGEYKNYTWLMAKDGVPMVGVNYTESVTHALYGEYAGVAWNFMKHYSRDPITKAVIYDPYVK